MVLILFMEKYWKKLSVMLQRKKNHFTACGYLVVTTLLLFLLWDPGFLDRNTTTEELTGHTQFDDPLLGGTRPTKEPLPKRMGFDFLPTDFTCAEIFEKSGHGYTYSESYWFHVDAFKGVLQMNDAIEEGVANEQSWIISEIGELSFVNNICQTGFGLGHYTFHFLVGQDNSILMSFGGGTNEKAFELQDFMTIEFPDRFFGYSGNSSQGIENWMKEMKAKAKCDVIFIDTSENEDVIRQNLKLLHKAANPQENVLIFDSHPSNNSAAAKIWDDLVSERKITNHFKCSTDNYDDSGTPTNQRGLTVGSFVV